MMCMEYKAAYVKTHVSDKNNNFHEVQWTEK